MSPATPAPDAANIRWRSGNFSRLKPPPPPPPPPRIPPAEEDSVGETVSVGSDPISDAPFVVDAEVETGAEVPAVVAADAGADVDAVSLVAVVVGTPELVLELVAAPPNVDPGTVMSNGGLYSNFPVASSMILSPYLLPAPIVDESSKVFGTFQTNDPELAILAKTC